MRRIGEIHTFEDRAFLQGIVRMSAFVLAAGAASAVAWCVAARVLAGASGGEVLPNDLPKALGGFGAWLAGTGEVGVHVDATWWISLVAVSCAALAVHELVHGLFFRLFAPPGAHVSFGVNMGMGMLYASAEGIVYTRRQYLVIALAPSFAVTALIAAAGAVPAWPLWALIAGALHLSGCTGDWGYVRAILRNPCIVYCEDTAWGVAFYGKDSEVAR